MTQRMKKEMTQKTNTEQLQSEFEDEFLGDQIKELDKEIQITLEDANRFLEFILHYDNKLTQMESRLLEIRSLIESGQFNKGLEIELMTLIKRLQKLVDPNLKQKMINRLEVIKNFQDYASKKEEQLEWQIIRSRLDDFKNILQ
tara:strand:- start:1528 stop:1959 length:432 start_codon:yes stop_codon:yes gene_type:complete